LIQKKLDLFKLDPFSLDSKDKDLLFKKYLNDLTRYHYSKSNLYKKILSGFDYKYNKNYEVSELPFLTTSIFKELDLKSISSNQIFKTLLSSGTSGSSQSKIFLDKENATSQRLALSKIVSHFIGKNRLPMLIVNKDINFEKNKFDAKSAAIRGFSIFGKNHHYLLNPSNKINEEVLFNFVEKFGKKKFLIFGFTSDVYSAFFENSNFKEKIDLKNSILIHGGGWKKLENKKISNHLFKTNFLNKYNVKKIINYYGLVEQVGSIFFECPKCNVFMCSNFSDVIIRDKNFNQIENEEGIVQLISLLPKSYPGHNILTEDLGKLAKCNCGFKGKCFTIKGRVKNSEIRGCANV
tara:strand:+ start:29 stop:1081 length:1053 start_codon:yes stop_codon:yes gene_type:complete